MNGYPLVRLWATDDGESHFEDVEISYVDGQRGSDFVPLAGWSLLSLGPDFATGFHHSPRRQYVVNVKGSVEIEASDGEVRRFGPGSILLFEDTHGKGHRSRAFDHQERVALVLRPPEGEPLLPITRPQRARSERDSREAE